MATNWPASLPQVLLIEDLQGSAPDLRLEFQPDIGPAILRRRGTAGDSELAGHMIMTVAQLDTLLALWISDCASVLNFPDPNHSGVTLQLTFASKPGWKAVGYKYFKVSLQFRRKP